MLKSMTGYGRCESIVEGKKILAEIKSVNQRFSDYNIRVPRHLGYLEEDVRKFVSKRIFRGKVDIYISIENFEEADTQISLNEPLAKNYIEVLNQLKTQFNLDGEVTVGLVSRYSDIFHTERKEEDKDTVTKLVLGVVGEALDDFIAMREREGARIESDLTQRVEYMRTLAQKVEERSPQTVEEYRLRLYTKLKELLEDKDIDDARILTETAIFADKVAVNEETVRLSSHFDEYYQIIGDGESAGRRLDFLIQEINREVNTIGSKAQDIEIAKVVVELKGEIEKLREQIQNIE
ncbi:MAG: YicC family protein [Clostridia bacterium]|nr:YicC family protein [Clostridia bacterium]